MIIFELGVPQYLKAQVLMPDGSIPPSITGVIFLKRSSDGYYWDGSAWVAGYTPINVTSGVFDTTIGEFTYSWTATAYGQYTFGLDLTSPVFYALENVSVGLVSVYESEDVS